MNSTKMVDALQRAITEIINNPLIVDTSSTSDYKDKFSHKKCILMLTDGFDNNSRITSEFVKERLFSCQIDLVVVGYTKKEESCMKMRDLAYSTVDGLYVDYEAIENLDAAFLNMTEKMTGPITIVESF